MYYTHKETQFVYTQQNNFVQKSDIKGGVNSVRMTQQHPNIEQ